MVIQKFDYGVSGISLWWYRNFSMMIPEFLYVACGTALCCVRNFSMVFAESGYGVFLLQSA